MAKEEVGKNGQEGGGDGAGENDRVTYHGDPAENEGAETAGADGGGNCGYSDGDDGCGSYARENNA